MRAAPMVFAALVMEMLFSARASVAADKATEEARAHFRKGQQFFDVGRWDDAAEEFEQAYAARNDPTFIYNMAQSYRRKGDAKRALELYKNYLIKDPQTPKRAEVEERIVVLQQQVEEAKRASQSVPPPAPEPPPLPPPAPASPTSVPASFPAPAPAPRPAPASSSTAVHVASPKPSTPPSPSPGRGLRIGGLVCGAVGLAAIGAGAFFSLETDEYSSTVQRGEIFNPNFDDRGKLYEKLQWVGYGVGAGLLVTGTVLYIMGVKARSTAVAIVPFPGGAGLGARGAF